MIDLRSLSSDQQKYATFLGSHGWSELQIIQELRNLKHDSEN